MITALAEGGPGTAASAADLAGYVRDYEPEDPADLDGDDLAGQAGDDDDEDEDEDEPADLFLSDDDEFDDLTMEGLFLPVTLLWQALGAIGADERLTPLGWWGLPEAMLRVGAPSGGLDGPGPSAGLG